jgi:ribosome-associated heat shock protein Hsp15
MSVDKWLWAARFYKTRSLAQTAIAGGKVKLNDERSKPARELNVGNRLRGSACTLSCAVARISAKNSNGCAAILPARRSPTNA